MYLFELPRQVKAVQMSTHNICFYKKKKSENDIAKVSLNTPFKKSSAALSLKCVLFWWIFYYKFHSNFEKLKCTLQ